jgi:hypothetical protein
MEISSMVQRRSLLHLSLAVLAAGLIACEDGLPMFSMDASPDTGTRADTGGTSEDAAEDTDGAEQPDSGEMVDAGGGMDVESTDLETPDSGPPPTSFVATLTGAEENPPVNTNATGSATFTLDGTTLHYTIMHDVQNVTAAHLHRAPGGRNGNVIQPVTPDGTEHTLTLDPADIADLAAGRVYVNIHSMAHPGGEIRGQVLEPDEVLYVARLTGAQEVPPVETTESGTVAIILNATKDGIHVDLTTSIASPTGAHIHRNLAGANGPVVFPLTPLGMSIVADLAISAADLVDLEQGSFYVNVHTNAHPMGEIRGQILLPGERLYVAHLAGAQEVPATTSTQTGNGMIMLDYREENVRYLVTTSTTPRNAHVHNAPGGISGGVVFPLTPLGERMYGTQAVTPGWVNQLDRGLWYFNIHTRLFPGGEIRGQILRPGETLYTALLSGAQEVPPVATAATGGFGLILSATLDEVRYDGAYMGLTGETAAHIHNAPPGMEGSVIIPLMLDTMNDTLSGEAVVTPADVMELNAGNWYVNIHTVTATAGEIRGQLDRK